MVSDLLFCLPSLRVHRAFSWFTTKTTDHLASFRVLKSKKRLRAPRAPGCVANLISFDLVEFPMGLPATNTVRFLFRFSALDGASGLLVVGVSFD